MKTENKDVFQSAVVLIGFTQCIGGLAWQITGIIFRFRSQGMICSGDYNMNKYLADWSEDVPGILVSSGMFI